LNYAFYARNNTLLPAVVGVISVGVYMVAAFALLHPWGYLGLVWADSAKQASHALIMLGLLRWRIGSLSAQVGRGLLYSSVAAFSMTVVMLLLIQRVGTSAVPTFWSDLTTLVTIGGSGFTVYLVVLLLLPVNEMRQVWAAVHRYVGWSLRLFSN
jgi:putative peptidoglycan lipid II flippase